MKKYIVNRVLEEYSYLVENLSTIRNTAKAFGISKSTVHKDISHRLYFIDKNKHRIAEKLLDENFKIKHIRGGESTKRKYRTMKLKYKNTRKLNSFGIMYY